MNRQIRISEGCLRLLEQFGADLSVSTFKPDGPGFFVIEITQEAFDYLLEKQRKGHGFSEVIVDDIFKHPDVRVIRPPMEIEISEVGMTGDDNEQGFECEICGDPLPDPYFQVEDVAAPDPKPSYWGGDTWMTCSQACADALKEKYQGQ